MALPIIGYKIEGRVGSTLSEAQRHVEMRPVEFFYFMGLIQHYLNEEPGSSARLFITSFA
jgi:hypothetical protein